MNDVNHRLLAVWAAACAEHVVHIFEEALPGDDRVRRALEQNHAWVRRKGTMRQALKAANARAAAREVTGAAKFAAYAAAQAVAIAHVAAHELGAAAYAIRAVKAAADEAERELAGLCLMTSGCAIMHAGSRSTAEQQGTMFFHINYFPTVDMAMAFVGSLKGGRA